MSQEYSQVCGQVKPTVGKPCHSQGCGQGCRQGVGRGCDLSWRLSWGIPAVSSDSDLDGSQGNPHHGCWRIEHIGESHPKTEPQSSYNPIMKVNSYHFYCILSIWSESLNSAPAPGAGLSQSVNTSGQGCLQASCQAPYWSLPVYSIEPLKVNSWRCE